MTNGGQFQGAEGCPWKGALATVAMELFGSTMNRLSAIATVALLCCAAVAQPLAARADDEAKINARIGAGGTACKNRVAMKYPKAIMADISVELGATIKESIDAGTTTLSDIKKSGLSYNWTYKKHSGYCNTDGSSNVTEFVKSK